MPVMDEFREERQALRNGTLKEKISYFFYYYKWHLIVTIAVLAMVISFVTQLLNRKEIAFYACMLNSVELDAAADYNQGFAEYAGIDTGTCDILFDSSLYLTSDGLDESSVASTQKLMVYIAAGELDVIVSDPDGIQNYANNETFYDLREFLTPEQIAKYEPYFYYMDLAVAEAREEMLASDPDYTALPGYPDPRNPEAMEKPVPVGIYLENASGLKEHYYFTDENPVLAVTVNTPHPEAASKYIDYIFQQ